jgi:hypothetical protein
VVVLRTLAAQGGRSLVCEVRMRLLLDSLMRWIGVRLLLPLAGLRRCHRRRRHRRSPRGTGRQNLRSSRKPWVRVGLSFAHPASFAELRQWTTWNGV